MDSANLISIIIPVYNVQDYLDECIKSIINQTYKHLEIILVDDGSPDKCPEICDIWEKKDGRIKVIHKSNGGLSSARNAGLEIAHGEYISFVDSDDFLPNNAIEILYSRICQDNKIGIVSGQIYRYKDNSVSIFNKSWEITEEECLSTQDFFLKTMNMTISHTVWNKLYRKDLLSDIRFRNGRNNEDTLFMYDLGIKRQRL